MQGITPSRQKFKLTWLNGKVPTDSIAEQLQLIEEQHLFEPADGTTWYPIEHNEETFHVQVA